MENSIKAETFPFLRREQIKETLKESLEDVLDSSRIITTKTLEEELGLTGYSANKLIKEIEKNNPRFVPYKYMSKPIVLLKVEEGKSEEELQIDYLISQNDEIYNSLTEEGKTIRQISEDTGNTYVKVKTALQKFVDAGLVVEKGYHNAKYMRTDNLPEDFNFLKKENYLTIEKVSELLGLPPESSKSLLESLVSNRKLSVIESPVAENEFKPFPDIYCINEESELNYVSQRKALKQFFSETGLIKHEKYNSSLENIAEFLFVPKDFAESTLNLLISYGLAQKTKLGNYRLGDIAE